MGGPEEKSESGPPLARRRRGRPSFLAAWLGGGALPVAQWLLVRPLVDRQPPDPHIGLILWGLLLGFAYAAVWVVFERVQGARRWRWRPIVGPLLPFIAHGLMVTPIYVLYPFFEGADLGGAILAVVCIAGWIVYLVVASTDYEEGEGPGCWAKSVVYLSPIHLAFGLAVTSLGWPDYPLSLAIGGLVVDRLVRAVSSGPWFGARPS